MIDKNRAGVVEAADESDKRTFKFEIFLSKRMKLIDHELFDY